MDHLSKKLRIRSLEKLGGFFIALALTLLFFPAEAQATFKYWIGPNGGSFSTDANWSLTDGVVNPTTAPGPTDQAVFMSTPTNAVIDSDVTVEALILKGAYNATVTQQANVTVTGASYYFEVLAGTYTIASGNLTVNGLTRFFGGTFNAGSANVTLNTVDMTSGTVNGNSSTMVIGGTTNLSGGTINLSSNTTTFSGGTVTITSAPTISSAGGGTVLFTSAAATTNINQSVSLNNLTINKTDGVAQTLSGPASAPAVIVNGTLTLTNGLLNGSQIEARGDIFQASTFDGGTISLQITGTANQTFAGNATISAGKLPPIGISKTGGTLTLGDGVNNTLRMVASNWSYGQGTIDATTHDSTVYFEGTTNLSGGSMGFDNVYFPSGTVNLGAALDVNGNLTISGGSLKTNNYAINVGGDWVFSSGAFTPGIATVTFDGTNQSISGSNTFYNLIKTVGAAATLTFQSGTTQTVNNILQLEGASGAALSLRSSSPGSQWSINPKWTRQIRHLDVQDSNNVNSTPISTSDLNITNSGNNSNWNFGLSSVQFSASSASAAETTSSVQVTVVLSSSWPETVSVGYAVTAGTATGGTDYSLSSGTAVIPAGSLSASFNISILDDAIDETNETIVVSLSNPSNAVLGTRSTFSYTILDDEETLTGEDPVDPGTETEEEETAVGPTINSPSCTSDYVADNNLTLVECLMIVSGELDCGDMTAAEQDLCESGTACRFDTENTNFNDVCDNDGKCTVDLSCLDAGSGPLLTIDSEVLLDGNEEIVFDASELNADVILQVDGDNVTINGIDFVGNDEQIGIDVGASSNFTVDDSSFGHFNIGLNATGTSDITISDTYFGIESELISAPNNKGLVMDSVVEGSVNNAKISASEEVGFEIVMSTGITVCGTNFGSNANGNFHLVGANAIQATGMEVDEDSFNIAIGDAACSKPNLFRYNEVNLSAQGGGTRIGAKNQFAGASADSTYVITDAPFNCIPEIREVLAEEVSVELGEINVTIQGATPCVGSTIQVSVAQVTEEGANAGSQSARCENSSECPPLYITIGEATADELGEFEATVTVSVANNARNLNFAANSTSEELTGEAFTSQFSDDNDVSTVDASTVTGTGAGGGGGCQLSAAKSRSPEFNAGIILILFLPLIGLLVSRQQFRQPAKRK